MPRIRDRIYIFWALLICFKKLPRTLRNTFYKKNRLVASQLRIAIMPGGMDSTGLAVGLKKGFIVEKRKLPVKPSTRKGVRALASPPAPGLRANSLISAAVRCVPCGSSWRAKLLRSNSSRALKRHRCIIL